MPLVEWTRRDELLSDALDLRDKALGLKCDGGRYAVIEQINRYGTRYRDVTIPGLWPHEGMEQDEEDDRVPGYRESAPHVQLEQLESELQEYAKPVLTSEDRPSAGSAFAFDPRAVIESRWDDGWAAYLMVEKVQAWEVQVGLDTEDVAREDFQDERDYLAAIDAAILPPPPEPRSARTIKRRKGLLGGGRTPPPLPEEWRAKDATPRQTWSIEVEDVREAAPPAPSWPPRIIRSPTALTARRRWVQDTMISLEVIEKLRSAPGYGLGLSVDLCLIAFVVRGLEDRYPGA